MQCPAKGHGQSVTKRARLKQVCHVHNDTAGACKGSHEPDLPGDVDTKGEARLQQCTAEGAHRRIGSYNQGVS